MFNVFKKLKIRNITFLRFVFNSKVIKAVVIYPVSTDSSVGVEKCPQPPNLSSRCYSVSVKT